MKQITLEELLSAGCHFGHQVNRRNPKANDFIFEARSGINIINLEKTHEGLLKAAEFLKNLSEKGGYLIVVGTKRQAKSLVREEVERARTQGAKGIFYVNSRWVGGTLTNFSEVSKNFKKLLDLKKFLESSEKENYTKREVVLFEKEKNKLERLYGGIVDMDRIPDALYIVDTHLEDTAVKESKVVGIKTTGITDTNSDPSVIDLPIPANDDAVGSIKIITTFIIDAWIEGSAIARASADKQKPDVKGKKEDDKNSEEEKKDVEDKENKKSKVKTQKSVPVKSEPEPKLKAQK
ncbi:MAG: 30S ribosomal protein S2 [Candidatus Levybacteria bacterium RIFCSPHIGHO2_01_FULL_36_15]|nr:MAG: 30S ribosomal protein S2 [Candidatus Levybacteria bacterium RIFCSPHIGHO2_01_FULL_36_15]OGH39246.1 MAG: 30S ribosomal protein S2 [Candidatus Levybacteria bacterium RIFCSPLOWO2_01_FULL_36_10]